MKHLRMAGMMAALAIILFSSCTKIVGKGPVETETRSVTNFSGVSSEFSGKVNIHIEPDFHVEVSAQRNILDVLRTNVVGNVLHIDYKPGTRVRSHEDVVVDISMPLADLLRISGSGDMNVAGTTVVSGLELQLSGSGSIYLQNAEIENKIKASVSGSGNIEVFAGTAKKAELSISGSGSIRMADLETQTAETHISGSGDIKLSVSDALEAHISGSGSVYYVGNPIISTHISGSGRVIPL